MDSNFSKKEPTIYLEHLLSSGDPIPEELQPFFQKFITLCQRKLWHPLTIQLLAFQSKPSSSPYQIPIFENFVRRFAKQLNPLKVAEIGIIAARQLSDDPNRSIAFISSIFPLIQSTSPSSSSSTNASSSSSSGAAAPDSYNPEAYVLLTINSSNYNLLLGGLEITQSKVEECQKVLDRLDFGADTLVMGEFYRVSSEYYKAKADYVDYYRTSLLYLSCLPKPLTNSQLSKEEIVQRAHDLALSALLGETIYNFGELLLHPILDFLNKETTYDWLKDLLFAFNSGNLGKYDALCQFMEREPNLQAASPFLRQKICLMALLESVFKRHAKDRVMSFEVIANETQLPASEVEFLVMKALSLNLIRGKIDQVSQTCSITWVQPRVLDKSQLSGLKDRLSEWCRQVERVGDFIDRVGGVGGMGMEGRTGTEAFVGA